MEPFDGQSQNEKRRILYHTESNDGQIKSNTNICLIDGYNLINVSQSMAQLIIDHFVIERHIIQFKTYILLLLYNSYTLDILLEYIWRSDSKVIPFLNKVTKKFKYFVQNCSNDLNYIASIYDRLYDKSFYQFIQLRAIEEVT